MAFFGSNSSVSRPSLLNTEPKDVEVGNLPPDSTSSLAWSPVANLLAVASWSSHVRLYEVDAQGQAQGKAEFNHDAPVLSVVWSKDGTKVLSGGGDNKAKLFDLNTGQATQVAQHEQPIRIVKWIDQGNGLLATGSWDRTIKYWDLRTPNPVGAVQLAERCYTMDVRGNLMVVGTAERKIQIINLQSPTTVFKTLDSPLRWQTRVVSCFPDASGYALGTIEGRVAIQHLDEKMQSANFTFKCHRKDGPAPSKSQTVYAVNAISFHPLGTFTTAGSDGTWHSWDYSAKTRLKSFDFKGGPIVATDFNSTGSIFAYAVANDWSQGHTGNRPDFINKVFLHPCKDDEVKPRAKK
ncbi:Poly(A)+ RNA export protein [Microbotryum lychnidis-dioicae p1A1 Lamole]|uniref:Poly(A)+ RNA export protein n=1 Tax=Microbotryum lychnidis-dioicae (strain p1A1 Lamole / MvSl-1064) TaxID=683840 RepID=U5HCL4_USTV1|nr:Poly(A)+ RNA export protein [Microbotryum lychnidis-dioicae p1A1 Lamole]|eukprot:KDE04671.1 Poly(A)+ RNA export protein [Microbotryum lychnidis-dioicae p1A1 Lamole]